MMGLQNNENRPRSPTSSEYGSKSPPQRKIVRNQSSDMFMTESPISLSSTTSLSSQRGIDSDSNMDSNNTSKNNSLKSQSSSSESTCIDHDDNDDFCWFDTGNDTNTGEALRSAWMDVVKQVSSDAEKVLQPTQILNEWHNPQPSLSLKLSSNEILNAANYGVRISSCVSGFRICQYPSGEIRAEFHFVFCYGSMSYMTWKPYGEFKKLAEIVTKVHNDRTPFDKSLKEWQFLTEKKRWFRCLNIKYLIEKSIYLGRFMESLLHESPTPGLILAFVQNNRLQSLPSW